MSQRENSIREAIEALEGNPNLTVKAVATAYSVPRSTLRDRLSGSVPQQISQQGVQRLTPNQEEFLAEWILDMDARGFPPSHARTREMASRILSMNKDTAPLGKDWIPKFTKRNPRVASIVGRRIESLRVAGTNHTALENFYKLFKEVRDRFKIQTGDIWNMDEQGLGLGVCSNTKVLSSSKKTRTFVKSPQNREWVSVLECISATDRISKPLIIFKGNSLQTSWFEENTPDWTFTTSENGWTSKLIAMRWLTDVFLPQTKPDGGRPRMLVMDGHGSHVDVDFMWECKRNNVELVFLPPHSSHVLQPLDLGVFSP